MIMTMVASAARVARPPLAYSGPGIAVHTPCCISGSFWLITVDFLLSDSRIFLSGQ